MIIHYSLAYQIFPIENDDLNNLFFVKTKKIANVPIYGKSEKTQEQQRKVYIKF
jgi:hypothetical protein